MNILLIHQYAGNKGDRAVALALCRLILSAFPDAHIEISTSSPDLWKNEAYFIENKIQFLANSWDFTDAKPKVYWYFLQKLHKYTFTIFRFLYLKYTCLPLSSLLISPTFRKVAQKADYVISVGGHHFTTLLSRDLVSSINYDAMAVLSLGKRLICFSQSFGPFEFHNHKNEELTRKILSNCDKLLPRESSATLALMKFGIPDSLVQETYESVITLNSLLEEYVLPSQRQKCIGIAIYATQKRSAENHKSYVDILASFCNFVASQGFEIRFFPMEIKGTLPDDRPLIREIISHTKYQNLCTVFDEDMNVEKHILEVANCQVFIGHKTHSTIFAMATGTPLVGIAYHPKTKEFMKQYSVDQYCISDENISVEELKNTFIELTDHLDDVGKSLYDQSMRLSKKIHNNLSSLLSK